MGSMIGLDRNNYAEVPISHASNLTIALAFFTQFTGNHRHTKATANKSYFLLPSAHSEEQPKQHNAAITRGSRAGTREFDHLSCHYAQDTCVIRYGVNSQHCSFVLLAEFDIDRGAKLTYQFPQPLGADEGLDHFLLNQTPFNTIEPVLALETPDSPGKENKSDLLFVLNLVRTKHDKSVRSSVLMQTTLVERGAVVKLWRYVRHIRYPDIQEPPQHLKRKGNHGPMNSTGSHSSFDEDIIIRTKDGEQGRDRAAQIPVLGYPLP
ncbi:hypothetical protein BGY98DRAFT_1182354 [Russula aff. rugulosa BPL654]|nr:hypothetical protein BGY98DRAFT_1182354 [Russula aff. rugulosa BPL654]